MDDRKFTPPTEFPAEYVDEDGNKAVILGVSHNEDFPFIGFDALGRPEAWTKLGMCFNEYTSRYDIHDIPKRITTWHNVYLDASLGATGFTNRDQADRHRCSNPICVYRIERDEDGGNPEIFVEEV